MQILSPGQTADALPYAKLIEAVVRAAMQAANGDILAPARQVVPINEASVLLCMPAIASDLSVTKLITVHGNNPRHRFPAIQGEVIVFDTDTGERLALLDGPTVTARRTAAVTLAGIRALTPSLPVSALLIGSGVQADAHANALVEVFGLRELRVFSRDAIHAQLFCETLRARYPHVDIRPAADVKSGCSAVDVVIALTTATSPVIPANLAETTLAVGVGAFKPQMSELPAELLHRRQIVVDHLEGARHEAGDLLQANIDWDKVRDLAHVLQHGMEKTMVAPVLKTVGHAAWDLAAARVAVETIYG